MSYTANIIAAWKVVPFGKLVRRSQFIKDKTMTRIRMISNKHGRTHAPLAPLQGICRSRYIVPGHRVAQPRAGLFVPVGDGSHRPNGPKEHRPLDPAIVANLREDLILRWTYHSNTIEGNTLIVKDSFQPYWHSLEIQTPEAYPS